MNYSVVRFGSKQYKVSVNDTIEVEGTHGKPEDKIMLSEVLLTVSDGSLQIGKPLIAGASVQATVIENKKGEKIRVSKFKAKSRYRKTIGFRQTLTVLRIDSLGGKTEALRKGSETNKKIAATASNADDAETLKRNETQSKTKKSKKVSVSSMVAASNAARAKSPRVLTATKRSQ